MVPRNWLLPQLKPRSTFYRNSNPNGQIGIRAILFDSIVWYASNATPRAKGILVEFCVGKFGHPTMRATTQGGRGVAASILSANEHATTGLRREIARVGTAIFCSISTQRTVCNAQNSCISVSFICAEFFDEICIPLESDT